jgi:hypothetical protein
MDLTKMWYMSQAHPKKMPGRRYPIPFRRMEGRRDLAPIDLALECRMCYVRFPQETKTDRSERA